MNNGVKNFSFCYLFKLKLGNTEDFATNFGCAKLAVILDKLRSISPSFLINNESKKFENHFEQTSIDIGKIGTWKAYSFSIIEIMLKKINSLFNKYYIFVHKIHKSIYSISSLIPTAVSVRILAVTIYKKKINKNTCTHANKVITKSFYTCKSSKSKLSQFILRASNWSKGTIFITANNNNNNNKLFINKKFLLPCLIRI